MTIPTWWIAISGLFFLLGSAGFIAMMFMVVKLREMQRELQPKIERLADRVDSMAEKMESAASSAKSTVESVGSGTRGIVNALSGAMLGSAKNIEKVSTVLVTVMALVKVYKELSSLRARHPVDKDEAEAA